MLQRYTRFNQWLAIQITNGVSTMECAYIFAILALLGFPGWHATPTAYVQWVSQTFIQLVMLSVISVQQRIAADMQQRHQQEIRGMHAKQQEATRQHRAELATFQTQHATDMRDIHASHAALHVKIDSLLPPPPETPKRSHKKKPVATPEAA